MSGKVLSILVEEIASLGIWEHLTCAFFVIIAEESCMRHVDPNNICCASCMCVYIYGHISNRYYSFVGCNVPESEVSKHICPIKPVVNGLLPENRQENYTW